MSPIVDRRRAPFCWQNLDDLEAIRSRCPRANLSTTLAVYTTLTEMASKHHRNGGRAGFLETRNRIAELAGVSVRTADGALSRLAEFGLIGIEKRSEGRTRLPSRYCLEPHAAIAPPVQAQGSPLHISRASDSLKEDEDESTPCSQVAVVFAAWVKSTGRTTRTELDAERRRTIEKAIASHGLDDCLAAVRNIGLDAWARGANDRGRRFDDIKHALGDAERIERWRDWQRPAHSAESPSELLAATGQRAQRSQRRRRGAEALNRLIHEPEAT